MPFPLVSHDLRGDTCCKSNPCSPHMMAFLSSGFQASSLVFLLLNLILLHSSSSFFKCVLLGVRSASRMCMLVVSVIRFRVFSHYFFEITFVLVFGKSVAVLCYSLTWSGHKACTLWSVCSLCFGEWVNRSAVKSLASVIHHFCSLINLKSLFIKFLN